MKQRAHVYYPLVNCWNCGLCEKVEINYGTLIRDAKCPVCKCNQLHLIKDSK